jgi:acetyl-CoA carboxylase biotin carboxylase subunit
VYPGWTVPIDYDPLLAKLVAWGPDRLTAIRRLLRALEEYAIVGVETNLAFFREILRDVEFREGRLNTGFVADFFKRRLAGGSACPTLEPIAALAAAAHSTHGQRETRNEKPETSRWLSQGRSGMLR